MKRPVREGKSVADNDPVRTPARLLYCGADLCKPQDYGAASAFLKVVVKPKSF